MALIDSDVFPIYRSSDATTPHRKASISALLAMVPSASVTVGDAAPDPANEGDLWWDTESGSLYIYYEDLDSRQWVPASPPGSFVGALDDLADVDTIGATDGSMLVYVAADSEWKPTSAIDGGEYAV